MKRRPPPDRPSVRPARGPRPPRHERLEERESDRARPAPPALPRLRIDLYGIHAVREALLNPERRVTGIYAVPEQAEEVDSWVQAAGRAGLKRPDVAMPPRAAFDNACGRDAVHQGVGLTCDPLPETDLVDALRALSPADPACFVILDQVTDPHNMGAILRSACAFGATGLIVQRRHAPDLSPLIAKTACGAVEHLPICYETNLSRSIETLKEHDFSVIGLDERGDIALPDYAPPPRSVLVLGAEGPGLRRLVREGCTHLVRLPTHDPIASLNVSNAAAVALYHLLGKRS